GRAREYRDRPRRSPRERARRHRRAEGFQSMGVYGISAEFELRSGAPRGREVGAHNYGTENTKGSPASGLPFVFRPGKGRTSLQLVAVDDGTQRARSEAGRFLRALLCGALQHQRAETRHRGSAGAVSLLAHRQLTGGEVLEPEQSQFKAVLYADFLEEAREVNLHGAFGDHQRRGDFLVLETLREQAHELAFALREGHPAGAEEAIGESLLEPEFACLDLLEALHLEFGRQGFAQNAANAQAHGLE